MGDTSRDTQRLAGQQMSHGEGGGGGGGGGFQARSHALAARFSGTGVEPGTQYTEKVSCTVWKMMMMTYLN